MADRYIARALRPRTAWDDDEQVICGREVIVSDNAPIKTGLLDAHGTPLYRVPERWPLGFRK